MNPARIFRNATPEVQLMTATASTHSGKLEGDNQGGLFVFKGIPFAAPPIGNRRWLAPEKPAPWTGVRDARNFGAVSFQNRPATAALAAMAINDKQSEDCLYLNVWTPGLDARRRPVMVWIHGGGFTIGAGSQPIYDGSVLSRRGDAVIVSINYRLGPLGFIRLTDVSDGKIPSTGNEGMLDQIAALEWVRDNIAEFGGDPDNVTIFGESAGGMSVGTLLAMPTARGLFHKAIPQSGACHSGTPIARANRVAERVLARLGVAPANADAIRALTPVHLLTGTMLADGKTPDPAMGMAYQPVIDETNLPKAAIEMVANGSAPNVAVMVGSTLEEWKLFAMMDPKLSRLDRAGLGARIGRRLTPESADAIIDAYEKARAHRGDSAAPAELFSAIETDRIFRIPGVRLAEVQGRRESRVFNFLFTWRSPAMGGVLGSCHALEIGFIFGTNHLPGMSAFSGSGAPMEKLAGQMQDAWLAFARSGDPSCASIGTWSKYDESRRATMLFGETTTLEDAPYDDERRAWEAIPDRILGSL
jgi:para-nitrobenzyl esterase